MKGGPDSAMNRVFLLCLLIGFRVAGQVSGGQPSARGANGLVQDLQAGDRDVRRAAIRGLADLLVKKNVGSICDWSKQIAGALSDSDLDVRMTTTGILARCAAERPTVRAEILARQNAIINNLSSSEAKEREIILYLLPFLGPNLSQDLEAAVLQLLHDPSRKVSKAAIGALLAFKPFPTQAVSVLDSMIEQGDENRGYAEMVLGRTKASDPRTIQALIIGLKDRDRLFDRNLLWLLGELGTRHRKRSRMSKP
jgi:hypothetical protein